MAALFAAAFCGLFGFIWGGCGVMKLYERKIKSGYVQIDHEIYEARVVLRGRKIDKEAQ